MNKTKNTEKTTKQKYYVHATVLCTQNYVQRNDRILIK